MVYRCLAPPGVYVVVDGRNGDVLCYMIRGCCKRKECRPHCNDAGIGAVYVDPHFGLRLGGKVYRVDCSIADIRLVEYYLGS